MYIVCRMTAVYTAFAYSASHSKRVILFSVLFVQNYNLTFADGFWPVSMDKRLALSLQIMYEYLENVEELSTMKDIQQS